MTQRVFDIENEKDMHDLWDILPNYIDEIRGLQGCTSYLFSKGRCELDIPENIIKIRWHDKTRIIRPIKIEEATEADIGKLCKFVLKKPTENVNGGFGILTKIETDASCQTLYLKDREMWFNSCRRLTKQEIEELC